MTAGRILSDGIQNTSGLTLSVLFVDDEKNVLEGMRRGMHTMHSEWNMRFASSGTEALSMLQEAVADVVVSDMRMPGMSGRDLLIEVKRLYPQTVRFILSGYAESSSIMQVANTTHQFLSKPCANTVLKAAIARAFSLRLLLQDEHLLELVGKVDTLPSLPSIYQEIVSYLQAPDPVIAEVARIISTDIVMTTMLLKLANSAFFGAKQSFHSAERAVSFLGLDTITPLVLAHSIFNQFHVDVAVGRSLEDIWVHSLGTAANARAIARIELWTTDRVEEAFLAGLLHDVGKIVLATSMTPPAQTDSSGSEDPGAFGNDHHAAVGAYLLGLWGFSDNVVEAIAYHHTPSRAVSPEIGLTGLVHVADRFAHHPAADPAALEQLDLEHGYLTSFDLAGRLPGWQAACAKAANYSDRTENGQ